MAKFYIIASGTKLPSYGPDRHDTNQDDTNMGVNL
jgi:hypothetical protein